ncbi:MAG: hypothetical protein LLG14_24605, partial [Nocardiaceae bacterium]|nr:hypothetical protein [Nocardiaceae bacterium]
MSADTAERAVRQHADALVVLGMSQVILGGLVAAVTRPLALTHGSWLAAYLVLVGGVAQYTMGRVAALHQ